MIINMIGVMTERLQFEKLVVCQNIFHQEHVLCMVTFCTRVVGCPGHQQAEQGEEKKQVLYRTLVQGSDGVEKTGCIEGCEQAYRKSE